MGEPAGTGDAVPERRPPTVLEFWRGSVTDFYDSYDEMFEFFCDNTTIHGTIRLVCSKRNKLKTAFWSLLFTVTVILFYYTSALVFLQYYSYTVAVTMGLMFQQSTFPAITVCSLNPYRYEVVQSSLSQLDSMTGQALQQLYGYQPPATKAAGTAAAPGIRLDTGVVLERTGPDTVGFKLCNATGGDCFYQSYGSGVQAVTEWYTFQYVNIMSQVPSYIKQSDDANIEDFIFSCMFSGMPCSDSEYSRFHHPTYGNCYTFNSANSSKLWQASKPGRDYGLSLILRTEQNDYIPFLSTVAGARIMVHDQESPPFMEEGGFDMRPGFETSLGIRMLEATRMPDPYGNCTEDGSNVPVLNLYSSAYTVQACVRSCFQLALVEACGCGYYFYPLPPNASYCSYNNTAWGHCYYKLYRQFISDELGCVDKCAQPCTTKRFAVTPGYAAWPDSSSEKWIFNLLSLQNNYSVTTVRNDVAKLNVYFRELNMKTISESAATNVIWLLSNIGSQWSLWFGSSVLSWLEVGELGIDCCIMVFVLAYRRRRSRAERRRARGTGDSEAAPPPPPSFREALGCANAAYVGGNDDGGGGVAIGGPTERPPPWRRGSLTRNACSFSVVADISCPPAAAAKPTVGASRDAAAAEALPPDYGSLRRVPEGYVAVSPDPGGPPRGGAGAPLLSPRVSALVASGREVLRRRSASLTVVSFAVEEA
ncbi:epithelial sodium channel subunit alpha-like [Petromyzon marinus]|uniref:Amiloride-sensitive sodium channel subunit alpha-like isoform X2 n=1 Tax=Petromyzon marinus TaxID=7757 RepID=A0AAJ7TTT9_PETMA|nr:amiloride-sensitive sodium channel subunit alpha-like isoform X2 [Petromyzon marinus]